MKTRSTKRALWSSALAVLLCFAMLVGTTFAWFTDSVTSENNIIKSGNLDATFDYWNGSDWVTVEGASDILSADLFEPGYTEVAYFRVSNVGSLALKYQLGVNIVSETAGTNVAGEEFLLSDYIYFDVVPGQEPEFASRDAAMAYATEETKISAGYGDVQTLLSGDEVYLAMVVYMPETVDNVANHNGTDIPEINLGINIVATQVDFEEDSFDSAYDGGAAWFGDVEYDWYTGEEEMTLSSAADFAGFAALVNGTAAPATTTYAAREAAAVDSFSGKTITLATDIDLNGLNWTPIGNWDNAFEGTFDGNGYTIKNLYVNDATLEGAGLFGVAQNATIKNLTVENANVTGYEMVAAVVGSPYVGCEISNCHVTGDIKITAEYAYAGGIMAYGYSSVDNCSVIADGIGTITAKERNAVGGISAWMLEGNNSIKDCTVKNLNLTGWANIGAISGFIHYSNEISGCTAENLVLTKTRIDGNPSIGLAAGGYSYNANKASTIVDNTFENVTMSGTHIAYASYNEMYGSEYGGATSANFVLENNTVVNCQNNLEEVQVVKTVAALKAALAAGGEYSVAANIALTEGVTVPAGVEVTLNMNGYTISGTSSATGANFNLIDVRGTLTVNGGKLTTVHTGTNMAWNNSTNVFNVTAGGVLNLNDTYVENLGGSDMAFCVHLNNWGEVTLNAKNTTFKSTYVGIRVFNSGNDMNNVTLDGCTVETGNACFWVHNYTVADFGSEGKAETQKALLNLTFTDTTIARTNGSKSLVRFGMTDAIYYDSLDMDTVVAGTEAALKWALANGKNVILNNDLTFAATMSNAYGATGIVVDGQTIDGNGYTLTITGANTTWDSAIFIKSGTVKNLKVAGAFRGIFTSDAANGDIYLDNVSFDTVYTFNSDGAGTGYGVYISNSTMNGWTSYSKCHTEVVFTNCDFTLNGNAFLRAYNNTEFVDCRFDAATGFEFQVISGAVATLENCYYGDALITAENVMDLGVVYNTDASLIVVR